MRTWTNLLVHVGGILQSGYSSTGSCWSGRGGYRRGSGAGRSGTAWRGTRKTRRGDSVPGLTMTFTCKGGARELLRSRKVGDVVGVVRWRVHRGGRPQRVSSRYCMWYGGGCAVWRRCELRTHGRRGGGGRGGGQGASHLAAAKLRELAVDYLSQIIILRLHHTAALMSIILRYRLWLYRC